ncbi:DUF3152 domain-containing protein [Demequina pelophila]|uniref:DUF3152 domain-containing protein n=1 Tax=Demequina pelophila TaxID=1638984 RepID=UPI00138E0DA7|nr:DUF3152 domain-containing protein [Demequina pelophila]
MRQRSTGVFAGRGIALPPLWISALVVVAAFAAGIGAGWATGFVPDLYHAWTAEPEASASPTPEPRPTPDVSIDPIEPIERTLDDADRAAGLRSLTVPEAGEGTFTAALVDSEEREGAGPVKFVRVDVEDGLAINPEVLAQYVLDTLNDHRGWGAEGRQQFVLTDGVPDVRIVLASPVAAAILCPDEGAIGASSLDVEPSPAASPSAEPAASPSATLGCAERGVVPVSVEDWARGLDGYGEDRDGARRYLLGHGVGFTLGHDAVACESGRADVMADQRALPEACEPNPWPFPDAAEPAPVEGASPEPSPAADADSASPEASPAA